MPSYRFLFLFILSCSLFAEGIDYESLFSKESQIWQEGTKSKALDLKSGDFRWVTKGKTLRGVKSGSFYDLPTLETLIEVRDKKITKFVFSFYNRGDAGPITESSFENLKENLQGAVKRITASQPQKKRSERKRIRFAIIEKETTMTKGNTYVISESQTKKHKINGSRVPERYEYLRLTITPTASKKNTQIATDLNPKKSKDGTIELINIPMIDQGAKGYCVAATVARVMQFYGLEADQHQIAQIANTSSELGSNLDDTYTVLRRLGSKLGIRVDPIIELDSKDFLKMAKNFDRLAKRKKFPQVGDLSQYVSWTQIYGVYRNAPDLLIKSMNTHRDFKKFKSAIISKVNKKIPLLWSVMFGVIKEGKELPQTTGGHLRIISGYNFSKKGEETIVYTDSWGAGHERKTIAVDKAWAMTRGLAVITKRD